MFRDCDTHRFVLRAAARLALVALLATCAACQAPMSLESDPFEIQPAAKRATPRKGTVVSTAEVSDENIRPEESKALPIEGPNCFDRTPPLPYGACTACQLGPAGGCYYDEYLCDGGDELPGVQVGADWTVYGLGVEDTVGHYDMVPGATCVAPTNKVCIYAPRFRSVRHITRLAIDEEHNKATGVNEKLPPILVRGRNEPTTTLEQDQAFDDTQDRLALAYENRIHDGAMSMALKPVAFLDALLPYENLQVIRLGRFNQKERALLLEGSNAAITWTQDKAVQILIEGKAALSVTKDVNTESLYETEEPCPGKLRVIKVASTQFAKPGDIVDFTLRYDNIGSQTIGNITLVDNLTTRLEFVEKSAQSSRVAEFYTERNEAESLVLRWEITEPLKPGEGGVVRFKCRVR